MIALMLRMAWDSILSNKMRSLLTMLGIVIGIMSTTVMLSLAGGVQAGIFEEVGSLGSNFFQANLYKDAMALSDVNSLKTRSQNIAAISPAEMNGADVYYDRTKEAALLTGVSTDFVKIIDIKLSYGRHLKNVDIKNGSNVAVITYEFAEKIFGDVQQARGKLVEVYGQKIKIVGVAQKSAMGLVSYGDIILPYTVYTKLFDQDDATFIVASATEPAFLQAGMNELEAALGNYYGGDEEAFDVSTQTTFIDTMNQVVSITTILLSGIAAISLVVGGIGIMNIMLVSVTERTKEIGIRKAIGANRSDILMQFLAESMLISLMGAFLGLLLSVVVLGLLNIVGAQFNVSFVISGSTAALAIVFSLVVGLVFGVSPANKASKLQPIEALRHE